MTSRHRPYTDYWEALFEAKSSGAREAFYERARTSNPRQADFRGLQDPLAYLLAERGDIAEAKRIYQSQCRTHSYSISSPAFTCLMYASLSEMVGDRTGMWEGYDFACDELPFACPKASGPAEQRLIEAADRGDIKAAFQELHYVGLNVNARHGKALDEAVAHQLKELVEALLTCGADPNADHGIMTSAILGGDPDIPWLLLHHGLDPTRSYVFGRSYLYDAVDRGRLSLAEALIRKGADVNENDFVGVGTPLIGACERNNREMVKLLLQNGADPTITAKFQDPPLRSTTDPEIRRMLGIALNECKAGTRKCKEQP